MNAQDILDLSQLHEPPPEFSPGYFWSLNDPLDPEKLLAQLRDMRQHGLRCVCIHPMPPEFRPTTMATLMTPEYLSDDYFKIVRLLVDECKRLGMHFYLYDEAAWPSGGAAGRVYAHNPEKFAKRRVVCREIAKKPGAVVAIPSDALCASRKKRDGSLEILGPGERVSADELPIRCFHVEKIPVVTPGPAPRPDLLCNEAVQKFIELTYEGYRKWVGDEFGQTIRYAFTDEPAVVGTNLWRKGDWQITWTEDLPAEFLQRKGYDLVPHIPALFEEVRDKEATRCLLDLYDVWSRLFVERYVHPLLTWCRRNGVVFGGHFGGEDLPGTNADAGFGHILRALRAMDLPGIDAIWRQIYPGKSEPLIYPKYAASVARQQEGPDRALSESFMVYGAGLTIREMKWITDAQLVLGINRFVLGHYLYSTRDHFMGFARPFFGPANPVWKHATDYHKYVARMSYLLSLGRADCATAVYYPIRDIWAGGACRDSAIALHENIAEALLQRQCEFDYIDDDALAEATNKDGQLLIGKAAYSTVIIPSVSWMTEAALQAVGRFAEEGGRVLLIGGEVAADGDSRHPSVAAPLCEAYSQMADGAKRIDRLVRLEPDCPAIRACTRVLEHHRICFLVNDDDREVALKATFPGSGGLTPLLYDAEEDAFVRVEAVSGNLQSARLMLPPLGSVVVILTAKPEMFPTGEPRDVPALTEAARLESGWRLCPLRRYVVGRSDYEVHEMAGASATPCALGDWRGVLGEDFSGDAEYAVEFDAQVPANHADVYLDLGEVKHAAAISLNGVELGSRAWSPYHVEASHAIRSGKNVLKIVVTNTLANAITAPGVRETWDANLGQSWPEIKFAYDDRQRSFERQCLPSGLYGPVRILSHEPVPITVNTDQPA